MRNGHGGHGGRPNPRGCTVSVPPKDPVEGGPVGHPGGTPRGLPGDCQELLGLLQIFTDLLLDHVLVHGSM